MKKSIILSMLFLFAFVIVKAQIIKPKITAGLSGVYSMPQEDFSRQYKYGAGGEVYGGVGWGKTFLLATIGYKVYKEQDSVKTGSFTTIPVKLGIKQLLFMKRVFVQGDAGIITTRVGNFSSSGFTYDIGAGLRFAGLEAGLFYAAFKIDNAKKFTTVLNAKLGYTFTL